MYVKLLYLMRIQNKVRPQLPFPFLSCRLYAFLDLSHFHPEFGIAIRSNYHAIINSLSIFYRLLYIK